MRFNETTNLTSVVLSFFFVQIVVRQECTRKFSLALSPEEEILRNKMENMQALVSAPNQFKGRLSELLSQMRMQRYQWNNAHGNEYTLDKGASFFFGNFSLSE